MQELSFDFDVLEEFIEPESLDIEKVLYFPEKKKRGVKHYVNNADFCDALVKYKEDVRIAAENNYPKPRIPEYIGECFLKIAEGLSKKPNFYNYTFRLEFISDGIENALSYFENFDVNKSKNPFAYFTTIMAYAFIRRIAKEKKQQYIKYKATENFGILDEYELQDLGDGQLNQIEVYDNLYEFIKKYEETEFKKAPKVEKPNVIKGVEQFMDLD